MPNVLERLKQARQTQAGLVDALRRELRPLGFDIVPIANGGSAAPAGQYPCRIKGCSHPPLKTQAARLSHERSRHRAKAPRKEAAKKTE